MPNHPKNPGTVEERLATLETDMDRVVEAILKSSKRRAAVSAQSAAKFLALRSMVEEVLEKMGMPIAQAEKHFRTRTAHFLATNLEGVEDWDAPLAAELDELTKRSADIPDEFPPLFPRTPDGDEPNAG